MKIRTRFLIAFLIISVSPVLIVGELYYNQAETEITKQVLSHLSEIADAEKARIENELDAGNDILFSISSRTTLRNSLNEYTLLGNSQKLQQINQIITDAKSAIPKIESIYVVSLEGDILTSTKNAIIGQNISNEEFFMDALNNNPSVEIVEDEMYTLLSAPLILDNKTIGTIHTTLSTERIFSSEEKGFGTTGEYEVVKRDNEGNVILLHKLRLNSDELTPFVIPKDRVDSIMTQALLQQEGLFADSEDYRGKTVLAATRYIEPVDWGLVVKIDRDEALQSIGNIRIATLATSGVVAALAILVSLILSNKISKPIIALQKTSKKIREGNFDYPINTNIGSEEVKALAADLKHTSQELKKSLHEQKRQSTLKDQFINIAAHELKTPIQPIVNYSKLAKDGLVEKDKAIDVIIVEGNRLQKLSNDILDVSRIESGTMVYRKEVISINETLFHVVDLFQKSNPEITIELKFDRDTTVYADADRLSQVFVNIIGNAVEFTQKGTITVETIRKLEQGLIQIRIIDSAGGIPSEVMSSLFEKFVSKKSEETKIHGTGLGLFISKSIVTAHDGSITAENNENNGATFTITLPIKTINDN